LYEEETSQILYITCIIKEEKLNWMGIWASERLLNAKWAILQLSHGDNKLHVKEMMSALYLTNTRSGIFIVFIQSVGRHVTSLGHVILILSQLVFPP
jgi:hypothetical protein